MLGSIHTLLLNRSRDAEQASHAQAAKDNNCEEGAPCENGNDSDEVGEDQLVAAVENSRVRIVPGKVCPSIETLGVVGVSSEASCDDTPHATGAVHREGIEDVINLQEMDAAYSQEEGKKGGQAAEFL